MTSNRVGAPAVPKENNFDFLRFALATTVACQHYCAMTGRSPLPLPVTAPTAVSGFFFISGFLISMSFRNSTSLFEYAGKRARRILPAYIAVVIASFLTFSITSELTAENYFMHRESWEYLACNLLFLNFLHPTLPGVLTDATFTDSINPSLWTLKLELTLYAAVPLIATAATRKKTVLPIISLLLALLCYFLNWKADMTHISLYEKVAQWIYNSNMFLIGSWCLLYFDTFYRHRYPILIISLLLYPAKGCGWLDMLFPFALAGCVFGLAFMPGFLNRFGKIGDLSYGTYLYHAPIIQFFAAMGWDNDHTLPLILGITYLLSFASWHWMEKKILKRGKNKTQNTEK